LNITYFRINLLFAIALISRTEINTQLREAPYYFWIMYLPFILTFYMYKKLYFWLLSH